MRNTTSECFSKSTLNISSNWVDKLLATAILLGCFSIPIMGQDAEIIRFDVALVTVNVAVKDGKGRPLSGLKPVDFRVNDENTSVTLEFFESGGPASIVFVVDTSASMRGKRWKSLVAGLKNFLKHAPDDNDYTLITFDVSPRLVAESVNASEFLERISELSPNGETAMYDGVLLGMDALKRVRQRHKALVLISDGEDNSSRRRLVDVQREVVAQRTTIYTIGLLLKGYCRMGVKEACHGKDTISEMAQVTAGLAHFPDSDELAEVLKDIGKDISNMYSLSYYPPDKKPGWRRVQVSMAQTDHRPNLRYQERYLMR